MTNAGRDLATQFRIMKRSVLPEVTIVYYSILHYDTNLYWFKCISICRLVYMHELNKVGVG